MSDENRKKQAEILAKWVPFFLIACILIGAALGSWLVYFIQGEFPFEVLIGGVVATTVLTFIEVIKQKRKKDNVPEADERTIQNLFHFFAYVSHFFLALLFIALGFFTLIGEESISSLYLWIFFFLYIWVAGVGSFIIKRK